MELVHRLFSTRGGTLVLAGLAALLATIAVLVYLSNYRSSVRAGGQPATVLVAKSLIAKGTPGTVVAANHQFQATSIRESQLRDGALSDPSSLTGQVAAIDIYPGQQLTATEFVPVADTIPAKLVGAERAITLPLDTAHGLIGVIRPGDRVDVYAGFNVQPVDSQGRPVASGGQARPVLRLIVQNVPVLAINTGKSGLGGSNNGQSNTTVQVSPYQAAELAFASDNGKLWLVARPASGAGASPPNLVTIETMLLGVPPIQELKTLGGRG